MSAKLEIQLQAESYKPGDGVHGWVRAVEPIRSRGLSVSLEYREKTDDYSGFVLGVAPVRVHDGELAAGASYEFTLQLPADAPPAYSTPLGEMCWAVVARSDVMGPDKVVMKRIEVGAPAHGATVH